MVAVLAGGCGPRKLQPRVPIAGFDAPDAVKASFERDHPNASVRRVSPVKYRDGRKLIAVDYTTLRRDNERVLYDEGGDRIDPKTGK
jgi:hypothetical protein